MNTPELVGLAVTLSPTHMSGKYPRLWFFWKENRNKKHVDYKTATAYFVLTANLDNYRTVAR